ncbi:hypothetical protein [Microvirga sp. 2TAF3]|uniref:hypothetical protein n=1 Tax=Microvirga sp. 2TAF3 TaxID=3233014 RepID=UPI003F994C07
MFRRLLVIAAATLLLGVQAAQASDRPLQLCPGSFESMATDSLLRDAMKAAYPNISERKKNLKIAEPEQCIYPYQAIPYADAVVLLTLGQTPGDACHGCPAKVSADFLKRDKERLIPITRQNDFAKSGTWGDLTSVTSVRWGTEDGIVIEGGGTFQGESSSTIQAFTFREERALAISPEGGILLSQSNCDGAETGAPCTDITGTWKVDQAGRLRITYRGKRDGRTRVNTKVVYERQGDILALTSGKLPF